MIFLKRKKSILSVSCIIASILFSFSGFAAVKKSGSNNVSNTLNSEGQVNAPAGTPTFAIQQIENKMEAYKTDSDLTQDERAVNQKLKSEIIKGTFDLRELCRLSLDRHWNTMSGDQHAHFVNLMTSLLETKAIFSKEQSKTRGESYTVRYLGDEYSHRKTQALSRTQVVVPKKNITLDIEYKLKKEGGEWKVFDIIVDGASLVQNYKFQFNNIISKHGYNELIRRMTNKLQEIKAKGRPS